ncbi:MAG: structural protein P5 [Pseudomonadota bacterium]
MPNQTRGIRNNNPGNIEKGAPWQGLARPEQMSAVQRAEPRFAVFAEPKWGIRALARLLLTYQARHRLKTVEAMIRRYAPAQENHTEHYARFVADRMGLAIDEPFPFGDHVYATAMVAAIIEYENGQQPYDSATIDAGLMLAGIEPPRRVPWPGRSRTTTGTAVAGVGTALSVAAQPLQEAASQIEPLLPLSPHLKWVFLGLTLLGLVIATFARIDASMKGKIG